MKRLHTLAALAAAAVLATACGKSEPQFKARANAPLQVPQASTDAQSGTAEANEALKERLARQEAATKLFEKNKPEPASASTKTELASARAEPASARASEPVKAPEPVRTAAAAPVASAPASAPARSVEVAAPKVEPAKAPTAEAATAAPPKLEVAAARAAASLPQPMLTPAKLVARVDPDFPREAVQAGADRGAVKARMTLDGNGNVTRVEVVEANPRRLFDRAVVRALSQWHFSDGPSGRTVETEVEFRLK